MLLEHLLIVGLLHLHSRYLRYRHMKGFVVGRVAIDGYLISYAKSVNADVVDVTGAGLYLDTP